MARNFRALVAALGLLALVGGDAAAQSGCGGQGASGALCGNAGASTGLPSLVQPTTLFDRTFGSAQGRVLQRGSGGWAASPNPTLGVNGSVGGAITLNGSSSGSVTVRVPAAAGGTVFQLPSSNGTSGYVLTTDGAGNTSWLNNAAGGTVTSVGLSMPGIFSVSGSPVTLTGTLTATLATQVANLVWAGPTTAPDAAPTFRALVGADLPNPSASTLGGVRSFAAVSSQWIRQISTSGVPTASQPAFTDISGTLAAAQCPNPGASSLGCIQSLAAVASRWINTISTSGVPGATQPNFTDLAGNVSLSQLPSISTSSVLGNNSGGTAVPSALTISQVLDFAGSTQGQILYRNAATWVPLSPGTSGQVLTTGGAAANPAWATVTGTGTVTSVATNNGITGGTITTTGTIGLDSIANGTLLANVSGISQHPTATAPTSVLDVIGSTQGNILYRAAGNWTVLAPGSNGQVLTMGATTPAWSSAGTITNVTISAGTGISTSGTCNISTTGTCTVTNSGVVTVKKQIFTSNGTYTPSTGMLYSVIECVGGGGGGGSAAAATTGQYGGGGGGAGGYSRVVVTAATVGASKTVTVGALGAGGAAGSNNGSSGSDTSVGTLCVGKGGSPGFFGSVSQFGAGALGGVAGTGDLTAVGGSGGTGIYSAVSPTTTVFGTSGYGGSSIFGSGGIAVQNGVGSGGGTTGGSGTGFGGGGAGGIAQSQSGGAFNAAGGSGTAGVVFITEYNSQ